MTSFQQEKNWSEMEATVAIADRIREYAKTHYIDAARRDGLDKISIRAGDVHDALGLTLNHANVCQALEGEKFQRLAGVIYVGYEGVPSKRSANSTFYFRISEGFDSVDGDDFQETRNVSQIQSVLDLTPSEFQELVQEYLTAKGFDGAEIEISIKFKI